MIATVAAKQSRIDSRITLASSDQARGQWAVKGGVERAFAIFDDDLTSNDALDDNWSDNHLDCNDIVLNDCTLSINITDEASKLNVNTATKEQLMYLPGITEAIADGIIDWRDQDNDTELNGAESGYYANLEIGYEIRNSSFQTLGELLKVKDMTPRILYGEDTNRNGKLDANENDGNQTPPNDNADGSLSQGWANLVTCYSYEENKDSLGNNRTNINEADENALVNNLNLPRSYALWIIEQREDEFESIGDLINNESPRQPQNTESEDPQPIDLQTFAQIVDSITTTNDEFVEGKININTAKARTLYCLLDGNSEKVRKIRDSRQMQVGGFTSIADLLTSSILTTEEFKSIANQITTKSNVFEVYCHSISNTTNASYQAHAIVDRTSTSGGQILYWYEGAQF